MTTSYMFEQTTYKYTLFKQATISKPKQRGFFFQIWWEYSMGTSSLKMTNVYDYASDIPSLRKRIAFPLLRGLILLSKTTDTIVRQGPSQKWGYEKEIKCRWNCVLAYFQYNMREIPYFHYYFSKYLLLIIKFVHNQPGFSFHFRNSANNSAIFDRTASKECIQPIPKHGFRRRQKTMNRETL